MVAKKKVTKKKVTKKKALKNTAHKIGDPSDKKDICFTIMPFGGWFDDYYSSVYCPAIENSGLTPCRADDLYRPSTIINDIWSYTQKAKIILADLTGKNANVFYELGLAHALAKPAILVVENMDDVPFDLRALRIIEYNKNAPDWGNILKEKIEASIKEVLDSPAQSVLPAFLNVKESSKKTTVTEQEKDMIEMRQDLDMMRRELLNSRKRNMRDDIGEDEALSLIARYISLGMPESMIVRKVSGRGAPDNWVVDEIARFKSVRLASPAAEKPKKIPVKKKKVVRKKL